LSAPHSRRFDAARVSIAAMRPENVPTWVRSRCKVPTQTRPPRKNDFAEGFIGVSP
jgi:hypothetical protein